MLASGTGLAPMVPVLQTITDNAEDETFVTLVGCFKTFEGIYLKTFLQEQARFWNVRTFFVLSQVSPASWPPCPGAAVGILAPGRDRHPVPGKEGRSGSIWCMWMWELMLERWGHWPVCAGGEARSGAPG